MSTMHCILSIRLDIVQQVESMGLRVVSFCYRLVASVSLFCVGPAVLTIEIQDPQLGNSARRYLLDGGKKKGSEDKNIYISSAWNALHICSNTNTTLWLRSGCCATGENVVKMKVKSNPLVDSWMTVLHSVEIRTWLLVSCCFLNFLQCAGK